MADYGRAIGGRPVLVGHDAGAWVALAAAEPAHAAAVALVAPLPPGAPAVRAIAFELRVLWALVAGLPVSPPDVATSRLWSEAEGGPAEPVERDTDDPAAVRDVVWGRIMPSPATGVPSLLVTGERDRFLSVADAERLAARIGAERIVLPDAAHWPLGPRFFQATAGAVHRWVVRQLGAPLLELYPEAMAARDAEDDDP